MLAPGNGRMTWTCAASLALLAALMKSLSLLGPGRRVRNRLFFISSPLVSVDSLRRVGIATPGDVGRTLLRCGVTMGAFLFAHRLHGWLAATLNLSGWSLSYLAAPFVWLTGEAAGSVVRLLYLPTGRLVPLVHDHALAARSIAGFWGQGWNVWFSDWFRQMIFRPWHRMPVQAVVVVFLISGLMHEFVLNFTLWLITNHAPFGSMMIYFGLQALGILAERKWFSKGTPMNRCFVWLVVLGPAPLIVNEALLRTLRLWP